MCADSMQRTSQVGQTRTMFDDVQASPSTLTDNWILLREQWQALRSQAREVRAESRNHRHIAMMRRALNRKTYSRTY